MLDYKTLNNLRAEDMQVRKWERSEINRILNMSNPLRKREAYNKVFPKLALEGLTEEELNTVW